jgi:hypothetical protein
MIPARRFPRRAGVVAAELQPRFPLGPLTTNGQAMVSMSWLLPVVARVGYAGVLPFFRKARWIQSCGLLAGMVSRPPMRLKVWLSQLPRLAEQFSTWLIKSRGRCARFSSDF